MPTFDSPEPIFATIEIAAGSLLINASDRTDTVVDVHPTDLSDEADVRAAETTQVEYSGGRLSVRVSKAKARWWLFQWYGSIDVTVDLPTGSRVEVSAGDAEVRCEGRLGDSKVETSSGDIHIDQTGKLTVTSADGSISVGRSVGQTSASAANGDIWIREIDGSATLKSANADIALGEVAGDARLTTAHGNITVDHALASVSAKSATGNVRIGEAARGSLVLESAYGELEVGIREGTAVWLDVSTESGSVRSSLEPADGPAASDETVEVRARNGYGDIVIHRS